MNLQDCQGFIAALRRPPGVDLAIAIKQGKVAVPLTDEQLRVARGRIREIGYDLLPGAEAELLNVKDRVDRTLQDMAPRHRDEEHLPDDLRGALNGARKLPAALKQQKSVLEEAVAGTAEAREQAEKAKQEEMAASLPGRAAKLVAEVKAGAKLARQVIALADAAGGSLQEALAPVLAAEARCSDLRAEADWLAGKGHEVPDVPSVAVPDGLRAALEGLLGEPVSPPRRSQRWRQWEAQERARREDEAALARQPRKGKARAEMTMTLT